MNIKRGGIQVFSLSFLDVLSCALGAIIILFIVVPKAPPSPEVEQRIVQRLKIFNQSLQNENKTLKQELKKIGFHSLKREGVLVCMRGANQ